MIKKELFSFTQYEILIKADILPNYHFNLFIYHLFAIFQKNRKTLIIIQKPE